MVRLRPEESFIPTLEETLGRRIIMVKQALGGKPIRNWYKNWKPLEGNEPWAEPELYDSLMNEVYTKIENKEVVTVTFIWMQGERDAREKFGNVYANSLIGLYHQLSEDLGRQDVNFVIGRLSDFDLENTIYPHWTLVRDAQVKVGESNPRFGWIDTDDLNDGYNRRGEEIKNDLHMSDEGYVIMGQRFAQKSLELIEKHKKL